MNILEMKKTHIITLTIILTQSVKILINYNVQKHEKKIGASQAAKP